MSKKTRRSKRKNNQHHTASPGKAIIAGITVSLISAISMITLTAIIIFATADPGKLVLPAALVSLYVSSFLGGLTASMALDGDTPCGIFCGIIYFAAILILSLCLPGGAAQKVGIGLSIALHAAAPVFSLLGALAASSMSQSRVKRKRYRNRS